MYSFDYFYQKNSSVQIDLEQIANLADEKLFVSVGGGIATGKSYMMERVKLGLPIIDIDECVKEIGGGKYNRMNLSAGRMVFNEMVEEFFGGNKSFIYMGTNANLSGTKKRLLRAREGNFTNILVHIETPLETAIKQSSHRVLFGERNEITYERIKQTMQESLLVFNELKTNGSLVDFYVHIKRTK
jgi:predicted ABC-type ATPase